MCMTNMVLYTQVVRAILPPQLHACSLTSLELLPKANKTPQAWDTSAIPPLRLNMLSLIPSCARFGTLYMVQSSICPLNPKRPSKSSLPGHWRNLLWRNSSLPFVTALWPHRWDACKRWHPPRPHRWQASFRSHSASCHDFERWTERLATSRRTVVQSKTWTWLKTAKRSLQIDPQAAWP